MKKLVVTSKLTFEIPEGITDTDALKMGSILSSMFDKRYTGQSPLGLGMEHECVSIDVIKTE